VELVAHRSLKLVARCRLESVVHCFSELVTCCRLEPAVGCLKSVARQRCEAIGPPPRLSPSPLAGEGRGEGAPRKGRLWQLHRLSLSREGKGEKTRPTR